MGDSVDWLGRTADRRIAEQGTKKTDGAAFMGLSTTSSKGIATRSEKLLGTRASLPVTRALLLGTRSYHFPS